MMLYSLGSFDDTVDNREMKRSSSTMANGNKEQKITYFAATHNQQTINIVDIVDDRGTKRSCHKTMIDKNSSNKKRKITVSGQYTGGDNDYRRGMKRQAIEKNNSNNDDRGTKRSCHKTMIDKNSSNKKRKITVSGQYTGGDNDYRRGMKRQAIEKNNSNKKRNTTVSEKYTYGVNDDHGMKRSCQKMMISKNSSNKKRKITVFEQHTCGENNISMAIDLDSFAFDLDSVRSSFHMEANTMTIGNIDVGVIAEDASDSEFDSIMD